MAAHLPQPVLIQALHDGIPVVYDLQESVHQLCLLPALRLALQAF